MTTPLLLALSISVSEPIDTNLPSPIELESITITSTHSKTSHQSSSELILNQSELARFNINDGNTILQCQPGVYTQQEDGWGLRLNVGIRGTGVERSSRITLMEDGILTAPAAYSAPAAYYSPVLWKYHQIEILKGGAALITGPQSTGGAINFITSIPQEKDYHTLNLNSGAFGQLTAYTQGQFTLSERSQLLYGIQRNSARGFNRINTAAYGGFKLNDGYLKWVHRFDTDDRHRLEVFLARTNEESNQTYLGLSAEDAALNPNNRYLASALDSMTMGRFMSRIGYTFNLKNGWIRADLYRQTVQRNWYKLDKISDGMNSLGVATILADPYSYAGFFQALQGFHTDPYTATLKANNRSYKSQGLQLKSQFSNAFGPVQFKQEVGSRFHYDHADRFQHRNTYALTNDIPQRIANGILGAAGNRKDASRALSSYAKSTAIWNKWSIQLGLRGEFIQSERIDWGSNDKNREGNDLNERENSTFSILPGLSLCRAFDHWNMFTGIHKGMTPAGSKDGVLPENSLNTEIGIHHKSKPIDVTFFHSQYDRLLGSDAAATGGSGSGELFNGGSASITGIEGSWSMVKGNLTIKTSGTMTHAIFTESFSSQFDGWGDVEKGDRLPYLAPIQGNTQVLYEKGKWLMGIQIQALSARKSSASIEGYDLSRALVANLSSSYEINRHLNVQFGIQNLTNTRHIVAARPAGFRTFAPRMWTLGGLWNI
jgi:Fe(3+) dicitrate transport protein